MNELPAQDSGMLKRVGQQALSRDLETALGHRLEANQVEGGILFDVEQ